MALIHLHEFPRPERRRDGVNGKATTTPAGLATSRPPGVVGDFADYIYRSAIRQVREVAVVGSLGFVAGIAGRQWSTTGESAGLNEYLILLGKTGIGKEGGKKAIQRMLNQVRALVPMVSAFVGPTAVASGQALMRQLEKQPCFFSLWGEFGHTLQRITHPKAIGSDMYLMKALHDLYSLSGRDGVAGVTAYSETEKNIQTVHAPSVTIIGESTPEIFFECLEKSLIASGLVPRFLVHEYEGGRPPLNEQAGFPPPEELVKHVADLAATALEMQNQHRFMQVPLDPGAKGLLAAFNVEVDGIMNAAGSDEVVLQVYNRSHLHALKVTTLLAVGCNHRQPLGTAEHAKWAIEFVRRSVRTILRKFETGETGGGDAVKAEGQVRKKVEEFIRMSPEERKKYGVPKSMLQTDDARFFVPFSYFYRRLIAGDVQPFKDKPHMLQATLDNLVKSDALVRLDKNQAWQKFKSRADVYILGENWK